ncbi:SPL family radical SAM protein [Methylobacterium gossipiicola]|uniref:Spore photoproduct lyase n=1 Tax=Methylobacterium gossipiicola TaxID=582675 RepID=A0A1I2UQD4_9HYPH|nr:radical SAM protein [Methylobacterium gossipiicola]SFG77046.1 spore photoproduct lyase [Methylobacterium gossipiicola]
MPASPSADPSRLWRPRRVLITRAARGFAHGRAMAERAAALGAEIVELPGDRLMLPKPPDPRAAYREAKATLAVVVSPPSKRRPQPIPPSADWRFDLAEGCHAHCQYCYLAGSLAGPPITRAYANVNEILAVLPAHLGKGGVTSASAERAHEGTTFEGSCYADPLGIEHVTGSLAEAVRFFGRWDAPVQLRFTSKFGDVSSLIGLPHGRRVRVRMSVNAQGLIRYEGGTSPLQARLDALGRLARDGYRVGLTVAPIQPFPGWAAGYEDLFARAATALADSPDLDLTVELITHRFTPGSKTVLRDWYPGSDLDLDEAARTRKLTKFGATKFVYPGETMRDLRASLQDLLHRHLPDARLLYWT